MGTLDGRDGLVVQPTGSGKSICYYLPPLLTKKTVIVVSPTISLMTDQVAKFESKGISAILSWERHKGTRTFSRT